MRAMFCSPANAWAIWQVSLETNFLISSQRDGEEPSEAATEKGCSNRTDPLQLLHLQRLYFGTMRVDCTTSGWLWPSFWPACRRCHALIFLLRAMHDAVFCSRHSKYIPRTTVIKGFRLPTQTPHHRWSC